MPISRESVFLSFFLFLLKPLDLVFQVGRKIAHVEVLARGPSNPSSGRERAKGRYFSFSPFSDCRAKNTFRDSYKTVEREMKEK